MSSQLISTRSGFWFLCIFAACGLARGGAITDFPAGGTTITFDDLAGGNCNLCGPSLTNQYRGLGVIFNNPTFPGQDTVDTNLTYSIPGASGSNALFVYQGGGQQGVAPFQILFSTPVETVGFDWLSSFDSFLELDAYNQEGALLETVTYVGSSTPQGLGGFAGLQEAANISRLDVSYHPDFDPTRSYNFSIDNLSFTEVPEPSGVVMGGLGLFGGVLVRALILTTLKKGNPPVFSQG
jgi:hypothetical protein